MTRKPPQSETPTPPSRRKTKKATPTGRPRVNLALQGGGSHGAFTWGVLDRFLDDDGLDFAGLSGTSAGALNGAVLLSGYVQGHEGADDATARKHANVLFHLMGYLKEHLDTGDKAELAEETGLIIDIGEWVFRQAAEWVAHWRRRPSIRECAVASPTRSAASSARRPR